MRKDKAIAETLRILFGCNFQNYQYHWQDLHNGQHQINAPQKVHFRLTDGVAKRDFPLYRNTLQVLHTLREALQIFEIRLDQVSLGFTLKGIQYAFNSADDINNAAIQLDIEDREYDAQRVITIHLIVPNAIYAEKIAPFHPNSDRPREQKPQRLFEDETFAQIKTRLMLPTQLSQIADFDIKQETKNWFEKINQPWFDAKWQPSAMNAVFNLGRQSGNMKALDITFDPTENKLLQLKRILLLQDILTQFRLHEHFKCGGHVSLSNVSQGVNLFFGDNASPAKIFHVINTSSITSPMKLQLAMPASAHAVVIPPLASIQFDAPEHVLGYVIALKEYNSELVAGAPLFRQGGSLAGVVWYESDEEGDDQANDNAGYDDVPVRSFDLRGNSGSHQRNRAWFFDQVDADKQSAVKKQIADAKAAEENAVREKAAAILQKQREVLFKNRGEKRENVIDVATNSAVSSMIKTVNAQSNTGLVLFKRSMNEAKLAVLRDRLDEINEKGLTWLQEKLPDIHAQLTANPSLTQ